MKIQGAEGMSPENIRDEVNRGGRLVIYTYCVSIVVVTVKRPTEVRLIRSGHSPAAASWPYVTTSLLLGWWGFPWGPIYTIECLYRNLCGGLDVTDDVLRNLLAAPTAHKTGAVIPPPVPTSPVAMPPAAPPRRFDLRVAGLMLGAVCLIVGLGLSVYCFQKKQDLTVVLASGLDQPYSVSLNGKTYTLKPRTAEVLHLAEGDFVLQDAAGGKVVGGERTFTFTLPFFDHLHSERVAIVNPDRTAILVNAEVPYYSDGTMPPKNEPPVYTLLANQLSYFIPKPDYVIEKAEARISMPTGTTRLVKTRLEHLPDLDLDAAVQSLAEKSGYPAAREHLMLQARYRSDDELLRTAMQILNPEDVRPFYQLHLADRPVMVNWHRYYQQQMETHHPDHDLAAEYRDYLQREPGDGALIYLLGRQTADLVEQTKLWHAALAANPPCPYAYSAMGFDALSSGRFAEALENYEASFKAGISTTSLNHYRRQAYFALGRSGEILPELAAARKDDPFDLELADEEIRATYAIARDKAAIVKLKDAYLNAYKAAKPAEKYLADAEAYLQAGIAYVSGDLPAYARFISQFESPFYQFRAALTAGKLEEAAKTTKATDPNGELLLYLLAQRNGDAAAAELHFKTAHEAMKKADQEFRQVAAQLDTGKPDPRLICDLRMNIESKRILLTALGVRQSGDQAVYFDLARKLNFNLEFPHQFLQAFLKG